MGAWQDRNGSLAGQKWEIDRTEMRDWQKIICKTPHFCLFSATFGWFLPYVPVFLPFFTILQPGRTVWQSNFAQQNGIGKLGPPDRKKCWQERIEFWQDRMVGPPLKMTQLRLCLGIKNNNETLRRNCRERKLSTIIEIIYSHDDCDL